MATIYKMSDGALMTINMENYSEDEFLKEVEEFYLLCYGESYSRDFLGY